ncbi:MAG: ergothioneine biosynthesis protein EgtB, partial [Coleofasciculaceae cyanobacterium SM2_3_26]|nr:ergothioneine biosynthesis protein EgtB [Coleofasciculaceae cyanobacterium SM2_3_26]
DGLPKTDRVHLPLLPEVLTYLEVIRERVLEVLDTTSFEETEPLWRFLIQHECQHSETIALVLALQGRSHANGCTSLSQEVASALD